MLAARELYSPNCSCSQSKFFISARARKKIAVLECSRMLAKTIRHPYNWDLGINVPVQTQKWCDHYQNMRIMLAVLRFKKWGKLCSFTQIMLKFMLAQSIKVYSYILLGLDYYVCNADYEMLYRISPSYLKFSLPSFIIPFKKCITSPIFLLFERYICFSTADVIIENWQT